MDLMLIQAIGITFSEPISDLQLLTIEGVQSLVLVLI